MLVLLMKGIYKFRSSNGLRWHDIHTKLHKDLCSRVWGGGSHKPTFDQKEYFWQLWVHQYACSIIISILGPRTEFPV
jgi:hypothetical protein